MSHFLLLCLLWGGTPHDPTVSDLQEPHLATIQVADFKSQMQTKPGVLIDLRTPGEFEAGHLQEAKLVNFFDPDFKQQLSALDKNKRYYIYCAVGGRSGKALKVMQEMGFREVYDMAGGTTAWKGAGFPLEK